MPRRSHHPPASDPQLGHTETAAALAECLPEGDVLFAAESEAAAEAVARALCVAAPQAHVVLFPETDALPGHGLPASPANIGARMAALARLRDLSQGRRRGPVALIAAAGALAYACPEPADVRGLLTVEAGVSGGLRELLGEIAALGYVEDSRVDEPGEVALRGQVLDVFPGQSEHPVRIETEAGKITELRVYDLLDQRTMGEIDSLDIAPLIEPQGKARSSLAGHLPDARIVLDGRADERRRRVLKLAEEIGEGRAPPDHLLPRGAWDEATAGRDFLTLEREGEPPPRFVEGKQPLRAFARVARAALGEGDRLVLLGGHRDLRFLSRRAGKLLGREVQPAGSWADVAAAAPGSLLSLPMPCERGFRRKGVLAVAAADLLGSRAERGDAAAAALPALTDLAEIRTGDVVVHEDYGIGVVEGIEPMPGGGDDAGDAIRLAYANDGVRLVPVEQAHRIWRYGAEPAAVTLDRLDGSSWQKRRSEVERAVDDAARALAELAAARRTQTAPVLKGDPAAYERFAAGFPFTETSGQADAIDAVRDDLASGRPMDRLVIGDVGFGKTEVALRAAAIAAMDGRQVAVAAPTTVLARQHLETFRQRFRGFGLRIEALHRLATPAERRAVRKGLAEGGVNIVVGTSAVAGKGVAYKDLALVIIDEEQRFGAADKQKLRDLSAGHVLTMTATPIPRTLQAALVGIRQLSVIATPPARRQPVRTTLSVFDPGVMRAALLRERARRGQSFVVVPRIADMEGIARHLRELVPDLKLLQAHGEMPGPALDETMIRFSRGEGDVLLATNIVESGLDVPRANTIIVFRADRFGLAQLHQLRGRVGRGNLRGHMLMFTEAGKTVAPRTLKRLQTLEALNRLGAGFEISARDRDLRGAGDLLGDTQAGHVKLIGVGLYQHLLARAMDADKGMETMPRMPEVQLEPHGRLPEDWIGDQDTRLAAYMRLARIEGTEDADLLEAELEDRFGDLPDQARLFLRIARLRADARAAGIARVAAGPAGIALYPAPGAAPDAQGLGLEAGDGCLVLREGIEDPHARLTRAEELLAALADRAGG